MDYIEACNMNLLVVPQEILEFRDLKSLHLDSNRLESLPNGLFAALPSLDYLDLRFNQLFAVPSSIGVHRTLRTLLLQGNRIAALPVELGQVRTLSGLSLSENPLYFPSAEVVEQGVQALLLWLRERDGTIPTIESDSTFFTAEVTVIPQRQTSTEPTFAMEHTALPPPAMTVLPPIDPNPAPQSAPRVPIPKEIEAPPKSFQLAPQPQQQHATTADSEDPAQLLGDMKINMPDDNDEKDELESKPEPLPPQREVASNFEPAPRSAAKKAGNADKYDKLLQEKTRIAPKTPTGPLHFSL